MLLSAMAIVMVVDAHAGYPLGILQSVFPYGSFFMPLFVFISGYFFSEKNLINIRNYLWKQTKKLLLVYYIVNILAILLVLFLQWINSDFHWFGNFDLIYFLFIVPYTIGYEIDILFPCWFVAALYMVIVFYHLLRSIIGRYWNDITAFVSMLFLGTFCVQKGAEINDKYSLFLGFFKVLFLIEFYEFGVIYRKYLENIVRSCSVWIVLPIPFLINIFLSILIDSHLSFGGMPILESSFVSPVVPIMTSYSGIIFYTVIADRLSCYGSIAENKLINYISTHTMQIMILHLPFMNLLNWILMHIPYFARTFDYNAFMSTPWYKYIFIDRMGKASNGGYALYFLFGLGGALLVCYGYDRLKKKADSCLKSKN